MKKLLNTLIMATVLLSLILIPKSIEGIGQHEVTDGTAIGYIENATIYEGLGHVFYSDNDSYVSDVGGDTNFGSEGFMIAEGPTGGGSYTSYSYIKFDLDSLIPNVTIVYSYLYLKTFGGYSPNYIKAYRVTSTWDEDTVTWNTKPTNDAIYTDHEDVDDYGVYYIWDVTSDVQLFSNGTDNYGWTLKPTEDNDFASINTKESGGGSSWYPFLIVEYEIPFNVTRDVSTDSESNDINFTSTNNFTDSVNLKIPLSNDVRGIVDVTNNTGSIQATEVNSTTYLVNNTYWYDSANQYVYIRTINLTYGMVVNWTVNCSYGITFNIPIPTYKEVGDDIVMSGRILNSTGFGLNISAHTHIYNSTGVDVVTPVHEWYCHYGNYWCTIPTSGLIPGVYSISIELIDPDTGITFKYGDTLYLSFETPDGVYSDAIVNFNFYNTNIGLGLISETFKVYVDDIRNYEYKYYGYTGQTINITVRDYYNFIMQTNEVTITDTYTGLNYGLTFHEYHFTNENGEAFYGSFLKDGATRWFEKVVPCSGGQNSFMLPTGNYTVRVYNADNSTYVEWTETVNRSRAYLIGTDGVTLIIQGLSVITGDILEFSQDLTDALLPSVVDVCYNIPTVWTKFRYEGLPIGWELVCPPQILTATTLNSSTGNNFTSYPLIPTTGTSENGTITVNKDKLYLGSGITWVNISYDGSYTNYTDIPPFISPFGANVTINASGNFTSIRETEFQQLKTFNYLHEADSGYYTATVEFENTVGSVIREVYCYIGFPIEDMEEDNTEPKYSTVKVYDVTNGEFIVSGENFDAGSTGMKFQIPSINVSSTRSFTCSFYVKESIDSPNYAITTEDTYTMKELHNRNYYYVDAQWVNEEGETFVGILTIGFNFSTYPYVIGENSVEVFDIDNNRFLDRDEFSFGGSEVTILQDTVGSVSPNSARSFGIYWLFANEDDDDMLTTGEVPEWLHTRLIPDFPIVGVFELFHALVIACVGIIIWSERAHRKKKDKIYRPISAFMMLVLFLSFFAYFS